MSTVDTGTGTDNERELQEAYRAADRLREHITDLTNRTGVYDGQIVCPREQSATTPCIARDGAVAVTLSAGAHPYGICVGCGQAVAPIVYAETSG